MFSDGIFPYNGYPPMSSRSWDVDDYLPRRNLEDYEPELYQPRVYNIPINVETPEGLVPLSRSTSHYPSSSRFHSNYNHDGNDESDYVENYHEPDRIDETVTRQRPGPSPIPSPKPKFKPTHHSDSQGYNHQPSYHSRENQRVYNIPIHIEKSSKSQETVSQQKDSIQNVPETEKRIFVDSNPVKDSPKSRQSDAPMNTDQSVNESQPQSKPAKPAETRKAPVDPLDLIKNIQEEASKLESEVDEFDGDNLKQYRYLDEMLTRCLLKLDNIDSEGREDVRSARKSTITHVDRVLATLESKFHKSNEPQAEQETTQVESNEQQSPDVNSSMDAVSVEADSTQSEESVDHTNNETNDFVESELSNEVETQMEVEGNANASEEMTSAHSAGYQCGNSDEVIDKGDNSIDSEYSSTNCSEEQLAEAELSIEIMDKEGSHDERSEEEHPEEERPDEPPTKINRPDEYEEVSSNQVTETGP